MSSISSRGYQSKYLVSDRNVWLKFDSVLTNGEYKGEAIAEVLVSLFLESCHKPLDFLKYRFLSDEQSYTFICESANFLGANEMFIPFRRLVSTNSSLALSGFHDKFSFISNTLGNTIGYDPSDFLLDLLLIDILFRNTDRHLSNFGVIAGSGGFRLAPMFDFGLSLGLSDSVYWDIDNVVSGNGFIIKPYELPVRDFTFEKRLLGLEFDVVRLVDIYLSSIKPKLCFDEGLLGNKLFGAFLNIICKYFERDCNGVLVKDYLESTIGNFRLRRYKRRV